MANRQFVLLPMREITNQNDPYYQQLDHLLNKTQTIIGLKDMDERCFHGPTKNSKGC